MAESGNVLETFTEKRASGAQRVYFVQACGGEWCIKIGTSENVDARIADLQVASAHPLKLLGTIPGGPEREAELHSEFAHYRVRGEWFAPSPTVVNRINALCGRKVKQGPLFEEILREAKFAAALSVMGPAKERRRRRQLRPEEMTDEIATAVVNALADLGLLIEDVRRHKRAGPDIRVGSAFVPPPTRR